MKIAVECSCGMVLEVPSASAGKTVECQWCGEMLDIPECRGSSAERADRGAGAARRGRRGEAPAGSAAGVPGWRTVAQGLGVLRISYIAMGITFIAGAIATMAVAQVAGPLVLVPLGLSLAAIACSCIAIVVGKAMCCAVPERTGLRSLGYGAVACIAAGVVLSVLVAVSRVAAAHPAIGLLPAIAGIAGEILFLLFLRGIGVHFESRRLAAGAVNFLVFWVALSAVSMALPFLPILSLAGGSFILLLMLCIVLLAVTGFAIFWYAAMVKSLRDLVLRMISRPRRAGRTPGHRAGARRSAAAAAN